MATTTQTAQLQTLFDDYMAKKALYDIEVTDNYKAHQGWNPNDPNGSASDASLAAKKLNMENALKAYNLFKEDLSAQDKAAFIAANPGQAVAIAKADADAVVESAKAKAAAEAKASQESQAMVFAQKNKQVILYAAVILIVVAVAVFSYFKFKKKLQP